MPSPFPGIDPYLEGPLYWQDLHERFLPYAAETLQPQLPPRYRARIGERVILTVVERTIIPDLTVVQRPSLRDTRGQTPGSAPGVVVEADAPMLFSAFPDDLREAFVEIIDRIGQRVITVIELLSPTNKTPGAGREQYVQKQHEALQSSTNLVEIDLLHGGAHTVAVPRANLVRYEPLHGLVSVWRAIQPLQYEVYFVRLQERLPRISIPLLPEDPDVALDLPAIFTRCYDAARYDLDLDYTQPPPVELSHPDLTWLEGWLQDKGRRA
jgi:Protein of unknown function (DUF4058)